MEFDFIIPLSIDALQESSSSRQYTVSHIYSVREINQKLPDCVQHFRKDGAGFIRNQTFFDLLYSALVHFRGLDEEIQFKIWDLSIKVMTSIASALQHILNDHHSNDCQSWVLNLKMNTYIACMLTEAFENNFNKPSTDTVSLGKKKGRRGPKKSDCGLDWEEERTRMLVQLFSLLQLPLSRLWDPPIMEEDYVNLVANCCYKILESSSMNLVRTKAARESVFQILGTLVKKYNHSLACSLKLMQLLQHFDYLVNPIACGLTLMIESYETKSILQELIREITKMDSVEIIKDSSGLRSYAQFFTEMGEKCPQHFILSLPLMITFLQQENYSLRNCILSVMGSIVLRILKSENLDSKSRTLRNECLGYLEDFIHDSHAFVRSKVLQIWQELVDGQAVPLTQLLPILKKTVQRIRDKSSHVRKNALHLLSSFLKANPFAAKLPLEELKKQYETELKTMEEMRPGASLDDSEEEHDNSSFENVWVQVAPSALRSLRKFIKDDATSDCDDDHSEGSEAEAIDEEDDLFTIPDELPLNDGVMLVGEALKQSKMQIAIKVLQKVIETHPDAEVLRCERGELPLTTQIYGKFKKLSVTQQELFTILHRIFISYLKMKHEEEEIRVDEAQKGKEQREQQRKEEKFQKQKLLCCYLRDSVNFAREINRAIPNVCQLLGSRQVTDTLEAIHFFVTASEFGVLNAITGVRRALMLVWSKEQTVKVGVVEAYRRLYINVEGSNERAKALVIVTNLTALITGATLGEMTSLEEIIAQFMKSGDINKHCITLLWERFTKTLPETTDDESRSALILLAMAANSEVSIISSNLSVLIGVGLGKSRSMDCSLVKYTCIALSKLATTKPKTDDKNPPSRFEKDHEMFQRLSEIIVEGFISTEDNQFSPMAVQAITTIYLLAENADIICGNIIKGMVKKLAEKSSEDRQMEMSPESLSVPMPVLSRFLTLVGHVALRQLVHLDTFIFTEMKRRSFLKEEQKAKKAKITKRRSRHSTSYSVSKGSNEGDVDEEMGLTGAVADDFEAEYIRSICDSETVSGETLLALFRPLIIAVCSNPTKYSDPNLRTASTLALAKFMLVSARCCEENLQLLFTILEKSTEEVIRANTITAIGDLTFRFPNLVEPWTSRIYARLADDSASVRCTTLTVLTHLILNDQVKVKGQISDIALCLTDEDTRIIGLAKLFFTELSHKGNALYNVIPDIISRLSDTEMNLPEERLRTIMSYIFGLIQKDRQLESLIEKLCNRLQASTVERQWRDITYCLSLLPYSEKGIRKLTENFACYSDKLHEEEVYTMFTGILANARKLPKGEKVLKAAEAKSAIEELAEKLEECRQKGVEAQNVVGRVKTDKEKRARTRKTPRKQKACKSEPDSSDEGSDFQLTQRENIPPERSTRSNTRMTTRKVFHSSSSESEMELCPSDTGKKRSHPTPRTRSNASTNQRLRKSSRR